MFLQNVRKLVKIYTYCYNKNHRITIIYSLSMIINVHGSVLSELQTTQLLL